MTNTPDQIKTAKAQNLSKRKVNFSSSAENSNEKASINLILNEKAEKKAVIEYSKDFSELTRTQSTFEDTENNLVFCMITYLKGKRSQEDEKNSQSHLNKKYNHPVYL